MSERPAICPTIETLRTLLDGELTGEPAHELRCHVENCRTCQQDLESILVQAELEFVKHRKSAVPSAQEEDFLRTLTETAPPLNWSAEGLVPSSLRPAKPGQASLRPALIPGYELLEELGRGGMGVVYKARQIRANRIVALKMILAAEHARPEDLLRFRTEAEAPARLRHPNIIQIFEVADVDNRPYFSMEFADRLSLADKLQRIPLPPYPAAAFVSLLADAIHYAHSQGVIHRDLKPANVLLQSPPGNAPESNRDLDKSESDSPGSSWHEILGAIPKIADFGLARKLDDPGQTRTGTVMGTPSYMAPEQAKGQVAGPSADVHALGAILYELLTGRAPFVGKSLPETLLQVQKEDPVPVHRLQPTIPRDLETVCLKCLEKEPQRRYGSARDLASDLRRFLNDEAVLARPPSLIYQWSKFARRNKLVVTQLAGLFVILALGVVLASFYGINESRQRTAAESYARQTEAARQVALIEAYQARVLAAQSSLLDNDPGQAARHLEAAPESFRGWEWWHLQSRLDESTSKLIFQPELKWPSVLLDKQRWCVVASGPRDVFFWDTFSRPLPISLARGPGLQGLLVAGRAGPCIVIGGANVPLRLVNEQGTTLRTFSRSGAVYHIALHVASDLLAVCFVGEPEVVYFFDINSGRQIGRSKGNGLARLCIAFRPDGQALTSGDVSGNVITWNPRTQTEVGSFLAHNSALRSVAYSSDGQRLLTASDDQTFRQFEATTGKLLETRYLGSLATAVRYSPDRQMIATAGVDRAVRIWSANGGEPLGTWLGHTSMITDLAYNADGTELATVGTDAVRLWQLRNGSGPRVLRGHNNYVYPVLFSPDGRWIASGGWDNAIRLWDAASAKPMAVFRGPTSWIAALAFSPDSSTLYSRSNDATIRAWRIPDGREIQRLRIEEDLFPAWTHGLAISPDGMRLFTVNQRRLVSWDLPALSTKTEFGAELNECRLVVNRGNGREVAVVERVYDPFDNDEVLLVDLGTKQIRQTLRGHRGRIHAVAFSPRGGWLATAGEDRAVRIWNCDTGDLLHTLEGHFNEVFAIAIHPNGTRMATAGRDRIIRLWDPTTGEQVLQMRGHTDYVYSLAFSPNGSTLCSGSGDTTVRLWDTFPISRRYPEGQQ